MTTVVDSDSGGSANTTLISDTHTTTIVSSNQTTDTTTTIVSSSSNDDTTLDDTSVCDDTPVRGRCNAKLVSGLPCQNQVICREDYLCKYHSEHDPVDPPRSVSPVDNSARAEYSLDIFNRQQRKELSVEMDGETVADNSEWKTTRAKHMKKDWDLSRSPNPTYDPTNDWPDDDRTNPYAQ